MFSESGISRHTREKSLRNDEEIVPSKGVAPDRNFNDYQTSCLYNKLKLMK